MKRISVDDYFMKIAFLSSQRGTCRRRKVGCVVVNERGHIISTGYNGNPVGHVHCIDTPCAGADLPSGSGLEDCEAIHAEINALIHCEDLNAVYKIYCTASPCIHCVKALLASKCVEIVYAADYPHSKSKELWTRSNRIWRHHDTSF